MLICITLSAVVAGMLSSLLFLFDNKGSLNAKLERKQITL